MIKFGPKAPQRIDKLAISKGYQSDISTLCFVLSILVGIVPPIIMQDKINSIAKPKTDVNAVAVPAASTAAAPATSTNTYAVGVADEIKKYKDLLDAGAITQEEYDAKKTQLLSL